MEAKPCGGMETGQHCDGEIGAASVVCLTHHASQEAHTERGPSLDLPPTSGGAQPAGPGRATPEGISSRLSSSGRAGLRVRRVHAHVGVLTEIDVAATLEKKLDVDVRPYKILGACNPPAAHRALQAEDKIGTMLPCNVILQGDGEGRTEVAAVDPVASMQSVENEDLRPVAEEIRERLRTVIDRL